MQVTYVPTPVNSLEDICKALRVGKDRVREWAEAGAPIAVEGEGDRRRYSTELAALLSWRIQSGKSDKV